jgi:RNA polymerase sigma factor (sigma-70 family)
VRAISPASAICPPGLGRRLPDTRPEEDFVSSGKNRPRQDPSAPDDELLAAAQAGGLWASEALLRRYSRMMSGMAYRLVGPDDVEDVVQESLFQALRSLPRLQHGDNLGTWLGAVVVHTAQKALRRRSMLSLLKLSKRSTLDPRAFVSNTAPPDVAAELSAVYRVIGTLAVKPRQALVLRRVEGRSIVEIAELMRASTASVKRWLAKAESSLAAQLGPPGGAGKEE